MPIPSKAKKNNGKATSLQVKLSLLKSRSYSSWWLEWQAWIGSLAEARSGTEDTGHDGTPNHKKEEKCPHQKALLDDVTKCHCHRD